MPFNPNKCEYLKVTNKLHSVQSHYYLNNISIKDTNHIKYLGVYIDNKLTWNKHIDFVVNKATNVKSLLQRNLKSCPTYMKNLCYLSLIRPILEYASTTWSAYTMLNITKLEKVQRQSARFVLQGILV